MAEDAQKLSNPQTAGLKPFKAGADWKGNPGGKPTGARNRLTAHFLHALADDFEGHGADAIKRCREERPEAYIKAIAALCPKEIEVKRPLQELEESELLTAVRALESYLAAGAAQEGSSTESERETAH